MTGSIGLYLGAVNIDIAQLDQSKFFTDQQYLFKPAPDLSKETLAESGYGIMIGMLIACYETKGHWIISGCLYFAGAEYAGGIPIE